MLKKLPIGIQTYSKIINENKLYIDKTESIFELVNDYQYVFLSRPRRFGKSLLMDTIHQLYAGEKELFKDQYIYDKWDWDKKHPVIKISFSGGIHNKKDFEYIITGILELNEKRLGINNNAITNINKRFGRLIIDVQEKYKQNVVILIDEYDKPILDNLDNIEAAKIIRDGLKDFYTNIKENDQYIKYAMLTGVSKFSKVSIFSGLNNLEDISLTPKYSDICGYTQNDVETVFAPYLKDVDMEKLKLWYNGYNFLGTKVYNPFDILLFIKNDKKYQNYWFETGTPSFLIKLIKEKGYFLPQLNGMEVDDSLVNSFDIEDISLETIMLQAGYLTIKEVIEKRNRYIYTLTYPNLEVQLSFYSYILKLFAGSHTSLLLGNDLYDIFEDGNINELENVIKRLFAGIAYNNFTKNEIDAYEGFYASVLYAYFASLGLELIAEDVTNKGRIDLTLKMNNRVFLFEFKVIDEDPLQQIKDKKYYEKYSGEVYIIGIVFDKKERNVTNFQWERV